MRPSTRRLSATKVGLDPPTSTGPSSKGAAIDDPPYATTPEVSGLQFAYIFPNLNSLEASIRPLSSSASALKESWVVDQVWRHN